MKISDMTESGLVMLGCGKMGSAMLRGWLASGLDPSAVHVIDPNPSPWLEGTGVSINKTLPAAPAVLLVAVKPQSMQDALPQVAQFGAAGTLILSIAAGTSIDAFEQAFGSDARIIRSMPNTPATIGKGITAMIGNAATKPEDLDLAEALLQAIGAVVRLESEDQIDAVTGLSGSGPAYVFHLIECLAAAGEAEGLAPELALQLAKATVAGGGALAETAAETPEQLRMNVTSPNGTTQAGLDVLMGDGGLEPLIRRTVSAASERSRELGK